jgi:hypothetical protein
MPPAQRVGDVLQNRHVRHEAEVLEHHAHPVPAQLDQLGLRQGQDVLAIDQHLPGRGLHQPGEAPHDRGLARPRQAHDDEDLAGMDVEADIAGRGNAVTLPQRLRGGGGVTRHRLLGRLQLVGRVRAEDLPDMATAYARLA